MEEERNISLAEVGISQPELTISSFIPETENVVEALSEIMPSNEVWVSANEIPKVEVSFLLAEVISALSLEGKYPPARRPGRLNISIGIGVGF